MLLQLGYEPQLPCKIGPLDKQRHQCGQGQGVQSRGERREGGRGEVEVLHTHHVGVNTADVDHRMELTLPFRHDY